MLAARFQISVATTTQRAVDSLTTTNGLIDIEVPTNRSSIPRPVPIGLSLADASISESKHVQMYSPSVSFELQFGPTMHLARAETGYGATARDVDHELGELCGIARAFGPLSGHASDLAYSGDRNR